LHAAKQPKLNMESIRTITPCVFVSLILVTMPQLARSTPTAPPLTLISDAESGSRVSRDHVETLIRQLQSSNRDPNPDMNPGPIKLLRGYDLDVQQKIEMVQAKLGSLGKEAFPALIEHMNDEGYSLSIETAVVRGLSVGEVCFLIIEQQVDPSPMRYKSRTGSDGKSHSCKGYFSQHLRKNRDREEMRRWWEKYQKLTLREMQIEAYEWRIASELKIGFLDASDRAARDKEG